MKEKKQNPSRTQAAVVGVKGLLQLGDLSLLVNPPTTQDLITVQKWVLSQPIASQKGISSKELEGLSAEDKKLVIDSYIKNRGAKRMPSEAEVVELLNTIEGTALQVWLASRDSHPDLLLEDVKTRITPENILKVKADLDLATRAPGDELDEEDPKASPGQN